MGCDSAPSREFAPLDGSPTVPFIELTAPPSTPPEASLDGAAMTRIAANWEEDGVVISEGPTSEDEARRIELAVSSGGDWSDGVDLVISDPTPPGLVTILVYSQLDDSNHPTGQPAIYECSRGATSNACDWKVQSDRTTIRLDVGSGVAMMVIATYLVPIDIQAALSQFTVRWGLVHL